MKLLGNACTGAVREIWWRSKAWSYNQLHRRELWLAALCRAPLGLCIATAALYLAGCVTEAPPLLRGPPGGASPMPQPQGGASLIRQPPPGGAIAAFPPLQEPDKITDNLYVIVGKGGNTAVWIYSQGVLLVDPKFQTQGPKLIEMIGKLTDKPITHIVCTHMHDDHCGSVGEFSNVQIIVQENSTAHMASMPQYKNVRPSRTFKDELTLFSGKDSVELHWFGRAHTDGDTVIVFRSAGVMHIGDIMKRKELPAPNFMNGGSGAQFHDTVAKLLADIRGVKWIIGGHSDQLLTWSDLRDYEQVAKLVLESERAGAAQGQSAEDVLAGIKLPAKYHEYQPDSNAGVMEVMAVRSTLQELKGEPK